MIVYLLLALVLLLCMVILFLLLGRSGENGVSSGQLRDEFMASRQELSSGLRDSRMELQESLQHIRLSVEDRLNALQQHNERKLEEMRMTVDDRLHETLEKRLSESFNQVSERLRTVHEGLGEMKTLAAGVGDLKKVLSNVKTRGILGEMQLQALLSSLLSPDQYEENVMTRPGSREQVEFALRLPGRDEDGGPVYLPIDAKFPLASYYRLLDARDEGEIESIRKAEREIEIEIRRCARDISEKYLNPPHTTDFGILFLPIEGLFAEVVRNTMLLEALQRDFSIVITGPTTLGALLNSLQMGFRTLAIQERTSEVWKVLAEVKREFSTFGSVLEKAQSRISQASSEIDKLVGVRTRKIQKSLQGVEGRLECSNGEEDGEQEEDQAV